MLNTNNLTKCFGKNKVLDDITLSLSDHNYGLLGPNGSGKTTLLRIFAGLIDADSGSIETGVSQLMIGYLPQRFGVFPYLTVKEQFLYFAALKKKKDDGINWTEEVDRAIEIAHLEEKRNKKCRSLSGGMLRRLGIAQAVMGNPDIILLDEPTVGLDIEERLRLKEIMNKVKGKQPLIFSTHIIDDVYDTCDQLLILTDGNIIFQGTAYELCSNKTLTQQNIQDGYLRLINGGQP